MADQLFVFLAQAIAEQSTGYRPGARHALLIFATAPSAEAAQRRAVGYAAEVGWLHIDVEGSNEVAEDTASIDDDTLRAAAEGAWQDGGAIVVYADEIAADA